MFILNGLSPKSSAHMIGYILQNRENEVAIVFDGPRF